jgi:hypothetical protein
LKCFVDSGKQKPKLKQDLGKEKRGSQGPTSTFFSYASHSACSSPVAERRSIDSRRSSERGSKKKRKMLDLKTFVESKLLSKSEKMLEKLEVIVIVSRLINAN